jgi:hypothetical protein
MQGAVGLNPQQSKKVTTFSEIFTQMKPMVGVPGG